MNNEHLFIFFRILIYYIRVLIFYEKVLNFINPLYVFYIIENINISIPFYLYLQHLKYKNVYITYKCQDHLKEQI